MPVTPVLFIAKGANDVGNLGKNQVIQFPVVIENTGNGYDVKTGIFRAPKKGAYLFSSTLLNNPPNSMNMDAIMSKNGGDDVWMSCRDNANYASCTATMAVTMEVGDEVWIKHKAGGEIDIWCSFTGILVTPLT